MDKEITYICDVCKENSMATEGRFKYYSRVSSLEASFMCADCSKYFSMAYEMIDIESSQNTERSMSLSKAYEVTYKEPLSNGECSKSFNMANEVTDKKLPPNVERSTSFSIVPAVTDREPSSNVECSMPFRMVYEVKDKKSLPDDESSTTFSEAYEVSDKETSSNVEYSTSFSKANEVTYKEPSSKGKYSKSMAKRKTSKTKETSLNLECSTSFSMTNKVTDKEMPPDECGEGSSISKKSEISVSDDDSRTENETRKIVEKDSHDRLFKCSICNVSYVYEASFRKHMNRHKGILNASSAKNCSNSKFISHLIKLNIPR